MAAGILLLSSLLFSTCSQEKEPEQQQKAGRELNFTHQVTFLDNRGESLVTIDVAVADEEYERNLGLMDVNNLPEDKGMLFIFEEQQPLNFWMANTPLSLDIIFVNEDQEIVRIHHSTQPFAERNFSSGSPARFVVETIGGFCISHDIQEGMQVTWQEPDR